jgi:flagellar biosynthesis/type III secretory pathway M-ring protein FliF/YscJ
MPQRSSPTLTTFGIIHLIFGILGLLVYLGGALISLLVMNANNSPLFAQAQEQQRLMEQQLPAMNVVQIATSIGGVVISILLIFGGMGLLYHRHWGRTASNIYGVLSILFTLFNTVWAVFFVLPAQYVAMEKMPGMNAPQIQLMKNVALVTAVIVGGLYLIYPVLTLIFLNNKAVVAQLQQGDSGRQRRRGEDEEYEDEDEDDEEERPRRRRRSRDVDDD